MTTATIMSTQQELLLPHPNRYRLHRAGICNVWQYDDQVFRFEGGRLLLRGKNGAGKSKALELLLPFLLDGDVKRLDATGAGKTTFRWLMSEGATGVNRQGFVWLELRRANEQDAAEYLTLGAAVRWSSSTAEARLTYFVTPLRVGPDFELVVDRQPAPLERLREVLGEAALLPNAREYRARVGREVFGINDAGRYRNLVHLLYRLRRPTIGDRIEAGQLTTELSEALPPVDDDVLDSVAHNLDDLETVREDLGRLESTHGALAELMTAYRGYLHGELRRRVLAVEESLAELRARRKSAGEAERAVAAAIDTEKAAEAGVREWDAAERQSRAELTALRDSADYRAVRDLGQRRLAVQALESAARSATRAAVAEQRALDDAAGRLRAETQRIAAIVTRRQERHRELREVAAEAGLDTGHLGVAPALRYGGAPADHSISLIQTAAAADELANYSEQLAVADDAVRARRRAVADLRNLLGQATEAAERATRAEGDSELLEGQQAAATQRLTEMTDAVSSASAGFAASVREWGLLPTPATADLAAIRAAVAGDDALPAETPDAVRTAAEAALEPIRAAAEGRRDSLRRDRDRAEQTLAQVRAEHRRWSELTDPEPPRSRFRTGDAEAGVPLYRLVDFAGHLDDRQRSGLEAALESSGLLDGLVADDGTLTAPETGEILLRPDAPAAGPALDRALVAVPGAERVGALLRSIGLGPATETTSWIAYDGSWRLGVAHGAWHKPAAEYVGAANRAALRERRLAELQLEIDELADTLAGIDERLAEVDRARTDLARALRALPDGIELRQAWARRDEAESALNRLAREVTAARHRARELRATANQRRAAAESAASAHLLPTEPEDLRRVDERLRRLNDDLPRHRHETATVVAQLSAYEEEIAQHARVHERAAVAAAEAMAAAEEHLAAEQAFATLEQSLGADEAAILDRETAAEKRLRAAEQQLPRARSRYQEDRDRRIRAESLRDEANQRRIGQEQITLEAGTALPRVLTLPGVTPALGLTASVDYDIGAGSPRDRIAQLDALAGRLRDALGTPRQDIGENALHLRYIDVRNRLPGGYDLVWEDRDGVKVVEIADDVGQHPVALATARLGAELDQKRSAVADRERHAFERFLLGELGDALFRQILSAETLVRSMNDTLAGVRTSHGLGARLVWGLRADSDADTRAAVELLRTALALRTRDQNDRLREVLARRVEDARRADPSAGYSTHLRAALDYRQWFTFTVKVTDNANPDRERTLSARTAMSQGEQRVVSYLVLFAAAAAHFSSVGDAYPRAPRLILLDDAFAKVDEPTHGRLLGLLVDLDLDAVLTSERLWGCFPEVPSLGIYECLRDPAQPGVATLHFRWDGTRRSVLAS